MVELQSLHRENLAKETKLCTQRKEHCIKIIGLSEGLDATCAGDRLMKAKPRGPKHSRWASPLSSSPRDEAHYVWQDGVNSMSK